MLASPPRAFTVAAFIAACALAFTTVAAEPKPAASTSRTAPAKAKKKPAAAAAKKPLPPLPPAPPPAPPAVELIGLVVMPPDAFRGGPPSGAFDGEGRRVASARFDGQPVQGVSSIKPGPTAGGRGG